MKCIVFGKGEYWNCVKPCLSEKLEVDFFIDNTKTVVAFTPPI